MFSTQMAIKDKCPKRRLQIYVNMKVEFYFLPFSEDFWSIFDFKIFTRKRPVIPPSIDTAMLIEKSKEFISPLCIICFGPNPNRPKAFIKNILPKIPIIVLPISPIEYFLKTNANRLAPINPIKILIRAIKVSVISKILTQRNIESEVFLRLYFQ